MTASVGESLWAPTDRFRNDDMQPQECMTGVLYTGTCGSGKRGVCVCVCVCVCCVCVCLCALVVILLGRRRRRRLHLIVSSRCVEDINPPSRLRDVATGPP